MADRAITIEPNTVEGHDADRARSLLTHLATLPGLLWLASFAALVIACRMHDGAWPISPEQVRHPLGFPQEIQHSTESEHWVALYVWSLFFALAGAPCLFLASLSLFTIRSAARMRTAGYSVATLLIGIVVACCEDGGEWLAWWLDC